MGGVDMGVGVGEGVGLGTAPLSSVTSGRVITELVDVGGSGLLSTVGAIPAARQATLLAAKAANLRKVRRLLDDDCTTVCFGFNFPSWPKGIPAIEYLASPF